MPTIPPRLFRRLLTFLLSPRSTAFALALALLILLGCMSISIGRFSGSQAEENGALCQEHEISLAAGCDREVFYPVPYASPPHLELDDTLGHFTIVEQREDRFRLRNTSPLRQSVTWKASGVKATIGVPVSIAPPVPPPVLPPDTGRPAG